MNIATVLLVLAAFAANSCCEAATVYTCSLNTQQCTEGKPDDLQDDSLAWFVDTGTILVEYFPKYQTISIANPLLEWSAIRDGDGLFMFANAKTSSVLVVHEGTGYVVHPCSTLQFKSPYAMWTTWIDVHNKDVKPLLENIAAHKSTKRRQGFDIRDVLKYVKEKGTVKGAPCFFLRRKLEQDVEKSFGDAFKVIFAKYQSKMATLGDKEAVFFATLLDASYKDMYKWIATIVSNNLEVDDVIVDTLYEGTNSGDGSVFKKYTDLYEFAMYLYETLQDAMEAYANGQFTVTRVSKSHESKEYDIGLAKDSRSGNWVIKICTNDGNVETYVMYNSDTWTFYCAITGIMMLFPAGDNFGLYNFRTGVAIAVKKESGMAAIFKDNAGTIKNFYKGNEVLLAIKSMATSINDKKISYLSAYTFQFSNFVRTSHLTGSVWPMISSFRCKLMLYRNFKCLAEGMRFIKDYCKDEGNANVVLYFFKYADLPRLKDDYVGMASAVGVRQSDFYCKETLSAVYTCALEKYKL